MSSVGAGRDDSYAVRSDGRMWGWGANDSGQVGDGSTVTRTSPVLLTQEGVSRAEGGSGHLLLLPAERKTANLPPTASFAAPVCTGLTCEVSSDSSDADGDIAAAAWDFGDGSAVEIGTSARHTYAVSSTYVITLTVTDDDGASARATRTVAVAEPPPASSPLEFRAATSAGGNGTTARLTLPDSVIEGDVVLLFLTTNSSTSAPAAPLGWSMLGTQTGGNPDMRTTFYWKTASVGDADSAVQISLLAFVKYDATVLVYGGASQTPVAGWAASAESISETTHTTPPIEVMAEGTWVVSFWAAKSSSSIVWSAPPSQVQRITTAGAGGGRLTTLVVDSGSPAARGTWEGIGAQTSMAIGKVTMVSVALQQAS